MYLRVRVTPGATRERVVRQTADHFLVAVKEQAEGNRANGRVRELLAAFFTVPVTQVRLIIGHHTTHKIFSVGN